MQVCSFGQAKPLPEVPLGSGIFFELDGTMTFAVKGIMRDGSGGGTVLAVFATEPYLLYASAVLGGGQGTVWELSEARIVPARSRDAVSGAGQTRLQLGALSPTVSDGLCVLLKTGQAWGPIYMNIETGEFPAKHPQLTGILITQWAVEVPDSVGGMVEVFRFPEQQDKS